MGRKIAWALSLAVLVLTGVLGVHNGVTEWKPDNSPAQKSVNVSVFLYGIFGLVTAYGFLRRRRWSVGTAIAWAVGVIYAPGVAVMAFGGEGAIVSSAIAASAVSALIASGVLWTVYLMTRGDTKAVTPS
jgi:hypothetical protein